MEINDIEKKATSTKKNGISGRSSNADIQRRINIGKSLLITKSFKTKKSFYCAYKKILLNKGLQPPESENTLSNDLKEMKEQLKMNGITFEQMKKSSDFELEGDLLKGKITHINISVNGHANTL